MAFTKNKDVDIYTLNLLNDYELSRVCQVNRDARKLCERPELWMQRFDKRYGKFMGSIEEVKKEFNIVNWSEFYKNFVHDVNYFNDMFIDVSTKGFYEEKPQKMLATFEAIENDDTKTIDKIEEEFFTGILNKPEMMKYFSVLIRTNPSYERVYNMDFSNPNRMQYFASLTDTNNPKVRKSWEILGNEIYNHPRK